MPFSPARRGWTPLTQPFQPFGFGFALGLLGYALGALGSLGLQVDVHAVQGFGLPVVLAAVWTVLHLVRRRSREP